jgi:hypothetical protein
MARKPPAALPPQPQPGIKHRDGAGKFKSPPAHKTARDHARGLRSQQTGQGETPGNDTDPGGSVDGPITRDPGMQDGAMGDNDSDGGDCEL